MLVEIMVLKKVSTKLIGMKNELSLGNDEH